jgi:hypothetical protein
MRRTFLKNVFFALMLICLSFANAACGGKLEGTYSNPSGMVMLDLRSGGKADMTMMGEIQHCTWKADSKNVTVKCGGDSLDFAIHDDGTLSGPTFVGIMKKSKD